MGITKRINLNSLLYFSIFGGFSVGQIIRLSLNFAGVTIPVQPIDIIVGGAALYAFLKKFKKPAVFKYFLNFMAVMVFSFILSYFIFKTPLVIYGLLYLFRLSAYVVFGVYVGISPRIVLKNKKFLLDCLLIVSVASAVFGWVQFFMVPDLKPLFALGWDMHLFRLVGTFLDPTYLVSLSYSD